MFVKVSNTFRFGVRSFIVMGIISIIIIVDDILGVLQHPETMICFGP